MTAGLCEVEAEGASLRHESRKLQSIATELKAYLRAGELEMTSETAACDRARAHSDAFETAIRHAREGANRLARGKGGLMQRYFREDKHFRLKASQNSKHPQRSHLIFSHLSLGF